MYTATGRDANPEDVERLIETGESERVFQRAIQENGRGQVPCTASSILIGNLVETDMKAVVFEREPFNEPSRKWPWPGANYCLFDYDRKVFWNGYEGSCSVRICVFQKAMQEYGRGQVPATDRKYSFDPDRKLFPTGYEGPCSHAVSCLL